MRQHRLMGWGCALLLTACSEALPPEIDPGEAQPGQAIQVGGVVMPGLSVQVETKAQTETPAEQVPWLKKPLEDGLDAHTCLEACMCRVRFARPHPKIAFG